MRKTLSLVLLCGSVLSVTGCGDIFFVNSRPGVRLALSVSGDPGDPDRARVLVIRGRDSVTVFDRVIEFAAAQEIHLRLTLPGAEPGLHEIQIELRRGADIVSSGGTQVNLVSAETNQATVVVTPVSLLVALETSSAAGVYRYPPDQMWVRCPMPSIQVSGGDTADSLRIVSARIGNEDIGPVHARAELTPRDVVSRRSGDFWKPFDSFEWGTGWEPGQRPGNPTIGWVLLWNVEYVARSTGVKTSAALQFSCK